jgi:Flp pilus assembly pilin Flp
VTNAVITMIVVIGNFTKGVFGKIGSAIRKSGKERIS